MLSSCGFSADFSGFEDVCESRVGRARRLTIRFAITTSVNILSPTTISSSSGTGADRDEKYFRMEEMHEYDGLNTLWRSTGTLR